MSTGLTTEQANYVRCSQIILDVVAEFLRLSYTQKWDARYFDCAPRLVAQRWDAMAPLVRGRLCWEGSDTYTALPGTVSLKGGESELATVHDLSMVERGSREEKLCIDGAEIVCRGVKDPMYKPGGGRMKLKANPDWVNGGEQQVCRGRTALKGELPGTFTLTGGRPTAR